MSPVFPISTPNFHHSSFCLALHTPKVLTYYKSETIPLNVCASINTVLYVALSPSTTLPDAVLLALGIRFAHDQSLPTRGNPNDDTMHQKLIWRILIPRSRSLSLWSLHYISTPLPVSTLINNFFVRLRTCVLCRKSKHFCFRVNISFAETTCSVARASVISRNISLRWD